MVVPSRSPAFRIVPDYRERYLMPPREDIALFLDLETTGSDKELDEIIEIGVVALDTTKEDVPEIRAFSSIVLPSAKAMHRLLSKKVVREMHEKNGLLDELYAGIDEMNSGHLGPPRHNPIYVSNQLNLWLNEIAGTDDTHIPYGGSGVMHFDRPFIDKTFTLFGRRLTYWAHDVGPIRRAYVKAGGVNWPDQEVGKTHRALDDARFHAEEWRFALRLFRGEEV